MSFEYIYFKKKLEVVIWGRFERWNTCMFSHCGEKTGFYIQEGPETSKFSEGGSLKVTQQVRDWAKTGPRALPVPPVQGIPYSAHHCLLYNTRS